ncbi:unnamed protein product [marine sediment metagenome]|uniref:Uncharacterized protein n=1 Tax=marine sediment metagenome TaxID=412755 RepID=X1AUQ3_9ZZZZ
MGAFCRWGGRVLEKYFIEPAKEMHGWSIDWIQELYPTYDIPDIDESPTYGSGQVRNTISEGIPVARCYGKCKIGANKIRFNAKDATDLRIIYGVCVGEIDHISTWFINDISSGDLKTGVFSHTSYEGTRTQTPDGRFTDRASAYRGMAYVAATFVKEDSQVGSDPHLVVTLDGLKCAPLAGGADAFTRNNAVIMYDWYLNVEGYSADDINLNSFKSLEALCNEEPTESAPRYRFDFSFDTNININDAKNLYGSLLMAG